jgi:chaperonin cofactor prefoldin
MNDSAQVSSMENSKAKISPVEREFASQNETLQRLEAVTDELYKALHGIMCERSDIAVKAVEEKAEPSSLLVESLKSSNARIGAVADKLQNILRDLEL